MSRTHSARVPITSRHQAARHGAPPNVPPRKRTQVVIKLLLSLGFALVLSALQIATGAEPVAAVLFSAAVVVWLSAWILGNELSAYLGILVLLWGGKIFGVAIVAKILMWESSTVTMEAPRETALVYLLGFAVILAAVTGQRVLPIPRQHGMLPRLTSAKEYIVLAATFLILGIILPIFIADRVTYVTAFRALSQFRDFTIPAAMYWAAMRGSKRPFAHPVVLALFGLCLVLGLSQTSKQGILTPIALYYLGIFSLSGFKHKGLLLPLIPLALAFQFVIGPVADTMKGQSSDLSTWARAKMMITANWNAFKNSQEVKNQLQDSRVDYRIRNEYYFESDVGYLERLSLLKTGDKLIVATLRQGETGWSTILWDLSCLPPRILYPNKPLQSSINQLARFAGSLNDEDFGTAVSFGLFPHLFHAFGYAGVVILGFITVGGVFWWFRLWFGDIPHLSFYGLMLVGLIHHGIAEDTFGTFLFFVYTPLLLRVVLVPIELLRRVRWI